MPRKPKRPQFEECIDIIDQEIKKRRNKWNLTALAWMDFDDVSPDSEVLHIQEMGHV